MQSIRKSCVLILSLSLLLFFCLGTISKAAENEDARILPPSTLVEGTWEVFGSAKLTFTYKQNHKVKHHSIVIGTTETWTFNPDGTFAALDNGITIDGSWREKGKNVTVYFNQAEYQTLLEEALAADGYPAIFTITKLSATGTVNTSAVKGKLTVNAHVYLPDYGLSGTVTATAHFAGGRIESDAVVNADPESESLRAATGEVVRKGLSLPEE